MEEGQQQQQLICAIVAVDPSNCFSYRVCSLCERSLSESAAHCMFCSRSNALSHSSTKRLFRVLISIASDTKVFVVICFDRAARVLFGCSADEFFDFAKLHPFAAETAGKILEGEIFRVTLAKPKNANAQHMRVVSVVPLRSDYQPAIVSLRQMYDVLSTS